MNAQQTEQRRVHSDTAQPDNYDSSGSSPPEASLATLVKQAASLREGRKYEDAVRLYRAILKKVRKLPTLVAGLQSELARCYTFLGQYRKAKYALLRAAGIVEGQLGPRHPDRALYLCNLVAIYEAQGKYAAAEYRCRQVHDILRHTVDQDGLTGLMPWNASRSFVDALASLNGTGGTGKYKNSLIEGRC
jgi:tetratricopeptide (TPR) repeat protein